MECVPLRTKQFLAFIHTYIRQQPCLKIDGSLNRLMQRVNYPQYNIWLKVLKLHSVNDLRIIGLIRFQHKAVTSRLIFVIVTVCGELVFKYYLNVM